MAERGTTNRCYFVWMFLSLQRLLNIASTSTSTEANKKKLTFFSVQNKSQILCNFFLVNDRILQFFCSQLHVGKAELFLVKFIPFKFGFYGIVIGNINIIMLNFYYYHHHLIVSDWL